MTDTPGPGVAAPRARPHEPAAPAPTGGAVVAIIPARGGSTRVPRKNIRPFHGEPLIARTIGLLRTSELFHSVVVSTDDDEIADVATDAGAEVPFRRPPELAADTAPTAPVIVHAVDHLEQTHGPLAATCVVYPAAVFLRHQDLVAARHRFARGDVDVVMSACTFPHPIWRAWQIDHHDRGTMVWPEHRMTRSQDLPETYHDAGQFYWASPQHWRAHDQPDGTPGNRCALLPLPRWLVHDIDTPEDWATAEAMYLALDHLGWR